MAENVQRRSEDLIPVLAEMGRIQIFKNIEISQITKKIKAHEYKLQKTIKDVEDYLTYIKFLVDLLKKIKTRRNLYGIKDKISTIDYKVSDKVNTLFQEAIYTFQAELRLWTLYLQFCKHAKYKNSVRRMITRMLQVHQDKPDCWVIAAMWEKEENNNIKGAEELLLKGLNFHPESSVLLKNIFKLTLEFAELKRKEASKKEEETSEKESQDPDLVTEYVKKAEVTYKHVLTKVKNVNLIIELLKIAKNFTNTEELQQQILTDLLQDYVDEPLVWDILARRELEGNLPRPLFQTSNTDMEGLEKNSLKDRITLCNEVYQTAVKRIDNEDIWSLYLNCLSEINEDTETLPNFKRKLLKNALLQGHQAKKLKDVYYEGWIHMMSATENSKTSQGKMYEIMTCATEIHPNSATLWNLRLKYLLSIDDKNAADIFKKAIKILGKESLPLWESNLVYIQAKSPEKVKDFFEAAMNADPTIANKMKPIYIEWLVLNGGIEVARSMYKKFCIIPPFCKELHKKMIELETMQLTIDLKNARYPHELMVQQFGKKSVDIWIDYIMFEMRYGESKNVSSLYSRAIKTLNSLYIADFTKEYSLLIAKSDVLNK